MKTLRAVVVAVALVAATAVASFALWGGGSEWEQRAQDALALADSLRGDVVVATARGDSLLVEASEWSARADRGTETIAVLQAALADVPVPEGCEVVVADRDRIIRFQELRYSDVSEAYRQSVLAVNQLRVATMKAMERGDSLATVLSERPRPRPAWIPQVAVGPFAGLCADGRACAGVGVQLSWNVEIF